MTDFLILGSTGNVGSAISSHFKKMDVSYGMLDRSQIDIENELNLLQAIQGDSKKVIINCVAHMSADRCENDKDQSELINHRFPIKLARLVLDHTPHTLIQISTDFVFDGHKLGEPYLPTDRVKPINTYGIHKALAEEGVLDVLRERARVVRISSFVGKTSRRSTFLDKLLNLNKLGLKLSVVDDLQISISTSRLLTLDLIEAFNGTDLIQHSANPGVTNWFELAKFFFELVKEQAKVERTTTAALGLPAQRPRFSALSSSARFERETNWDWRASVREEYWDEIVRVSV